MDQQLRGRSKRWLMLVPCACLIAGTLLAYSGREAGGLVSTVQAACNPGRTPSTGYWWDGWQRTPGGTVGGVYSTIDNYVGYVYGESDVSLWPLVFNTTSDRYAQDGWVVDPYLGLQEVFTEYVNSSGDNVATYYDFPVGASTTYTVLYNYPSSGMVTFEAAGSELAQVSVDFTPNAGQVMGEIHNYADQMPGGTGNHEEMTGGGIYYSGGWHAFSGSAYNSGSYFGNSIKSTTRVDIWDPKCSS